jgi:hypothetical protein
MESFIGLDLGQRNDYSALVILERVIERTQERDFTTYAWKVTEVQRLGVVHAERIALGTPYPDVVRYVAGAARHCAGLGRTFLAVDVTGVGAAVWDLLREQNLGKCWPMPVLITPGHKAHWWEGRHCVPKQDLVAGVVRAMEEGRLHAAEGLDLEELTREMRGFGVMTSARGRESFEGKKDDLVIALCLAVWATGMAAPGEPDRIWPGTPVAW